MWCTRTSTRRVNVLVLVRSLLAAAPFSWRFRWVLRPGQTAEHARLAGVPRNRVCIVFVHGFKESYYRVISHLAHLQQRLPGTLARVSIVGFTWPSTKIMASGTGGGTPHS